MRLSAVTVLVLFAALAADTEANWLKQTLQKVGKFTKETIRTQGVQIVKESIKRYGPMLLPLLRGKRSVDLPFLGSISDKSAQEMVSMLDLACSSLTGSKGERALNFDDVKAAFLASDEDKDNSLSKEEFNLFENTIEAVKHCWELLKMQGK